MSQDTIRPVMQRDLDALLEWRNHADTRRHMFHQNIISPDEHRAWFTRCEQDSAQHLLIVESENHPIGFVRFTARSSTSIFDWGFYVVPGSPVGSGKRLGRAALRHAFRELGAAEVHGQVTDSNQASLRFHESMGFIRQPVHHDRFFDGTEYHDVISFSLTKSTWIARQQAEDASDD